MARGKALIIGVQSVDPQAYGGKWDGKLNCPVNDASAIAELTGAHGFDNTILLTADATSDAIQDAISRAADELEDGDFFFVYYSGHGNRIKDRSGDEKDGHDEAWCLYNRQMLDDELYALWPRFDAGVRILVVSDSCHSGSITRSRRDPDLVVKAMDDRTSKALLKSDRERYREIRRALPKDEPIGASVMLISGCQDHQQSFERKSVGHGMLTKALLDAMGAGQIAGYKALHEAIEGSMPDLKLQAPKLSMIGAKNDAFMGEAPFRV